MQFKLDENLPVEAAPLLLAAGHSVHTVQDEQLVGSVDETIAEVCQREGRALITLDLDFADIRRYPPDEFAGLIVLRPHTQSRPSVLSLLSRVVSQLPADSPVGRLWIVDAAGIRIRSRA